jgi:hypothetical protein
LTLFREIESLALPALAGRPHFDARPAWCARERAIALSVFALMSKLTWM